MDVPNTHADTLREYLQFDYLGPDHNDLDGEKWGVDPRALAALDALVADRDRERARADAYAKTIERIWKQVAPGASYDDLGGRSIHDLIDALGRDHYRADQAEALVEDAAATMHQAARWCRNTRRARMTRAQIADALERDSAVLYVRLGGAT